MLSDMTKGPWHVEEGVEDSEGEFYVCHQGTVCDVTAVCATHSRSDAQAIAALPELIEALQAAVELVESGRLYEAQCCGGGHDCGCQGSTYADELLHYARAALTKAGGPQ